MKNKDYLGILGIIIIIVSIILKLLWNVHLLLNLIHGYSARNISIQELGSRIPWESHIWYIAPVLLLDTILTVLWLGRPKLFRVHRTVFLFTGWLFYCAVNIETVGPQGIGTFFILAVDVPFMYIAGVIPLIICSIGHGLLEKAIFIFQEKVYGGQK